MSSILEDLLNYPSHIEGIDSYVNKLRAKTDLIISQANTITNGNSTAILDVLRDIPSTQCPAGIAVWLALQADSVNGKNFPTFLFVSKSLLSNAPKSHLVLANKEG